jgi:hypothetical protein
VRLGRRGSANERRRGTGVRPRGAWDCRTGPGVPRPGLRRRRRRCGGPRCGRRRRRRGFGGGSRPPRSCRRPGGCARGGVGRPRWSGRRGLGCYWSRARPIPSRAGTRRRPRRPGSGPCRRWCISRAVRTGSTGAWRTGSKGCAGRRFRSPGGWIPEMPGVAGGGPPTGGSGEEGGDEDEDETLRVFIGG